MCSNKVRRMKKMSNIIQFYSEVTMNQLLRNSWRDMDDVCERTLNDRCHEHAIDQNHFELGLHSKRTKIGE